MAQRTLQQVKLERQQMEAEHSRQRAENVAEIEKLKMRLSALRDDLQNSGREICLQCERPTQAWSFRRPSRTPAA